jgi:hypothetical protein
MYYLRKETIMETKYIPVAGRLRSFRISAAEFALVALYVGSMMPSTDLTKITGIILLIIILAALFFGAIYAYRGFFEKMTLSINGIRYQAFGSSVFVRWANLERIGATNRAKNIEGVFATCQPEDINVWLPGMPLGKEIFILLAIFADNWRDSDLGRKVKQYAPHLFEQEKKTD